METILNKLENAISKGALLEEIVEGILIDLDFVNVVRQKSGAQYGYDITGIKQGNRDELWKFECKNLSKSVSIDDIAPKLIWHLGDEIVDRFIVVSVTDPSDYLKQLLDKVKFHIPIEFWSGEFLIQQILKSPRALKRLEINDNNTSTSSNATPIVYEPDLVRFDTICSEKLPYSFDYFNTEKDIIKAYTEEWVNLVTGFCNNNKHYGFTCTEINVITLNYHKVSGRVFRQSKLKGLAEPAKLLIVPSTIPGRSVPVLDAGHVLNVGANKDEFVLLELDTKKITPGYYELIFEAKGRSNGKDLTMYSGIFPLHVREPDADLMRLYTVGKFYDTPIVDILNLPQEKWKELKELNGTHMAYLGPTMREVIRGVRDTKWKIRTVQVTPTQDNNQYYSDVEMDQPSKLYHNFDKEIKEKLYSREDSFQKILGPDWQNKLGDQFKFPS